MSVALGFQGCSAVDPGHIAEVSGELSDLRSRYALVPSSTCQKLFVPPFVISLAFSLWPVNPGRCHWKQKQQRGWCGGSGAPEGCCSWSLSQPSSREVKQLCDLPEGGTPALLLPGPRGIPSFR